MENKPSSSKKKLISIKEEKLLREVDYYSLEESSGRPTKKLMLEILQKGSNLRNTAQKVLVSIKPRAPAIKTLYIAEKSRFNSKKRSDKSGSRLGIGDHSFFTTHFSEDDTTTVTSIASGTIQLKNRAQSEIIVERSSTSTLLVESSTTISKCSNTDTSSRVTIFNKKQRPDEKCYLYTQPHLTMTVPKVEKTTENKISPRKVDIGTLVTNISSVEKLPSPQNIIHINKRIDQLERKILRQEMVFRSLDPNIPLSSSDEEENKASSSNRRAGYSYVEYSHVPETSAFQRYSQQPAPLSASKATTIQKEHNSEQYGRDFTLYDGITARGRRQCASVPCKRDEGSKMAAERVHKIRHKLNPIRDYRLMDTVHYLAQGEFAPRDDGIKLTPSREAVLSDIIYEDVCRTHWPNARLARRVPHPDRYGTRSDLQHLIDSLLRERVAHVERRKRRHYRIVKLNHRHENCRPLGKTGDIIVASHKNRHGNEEITASDHNTTNVTGTERRRIDRNLCNTRHSYERLVLPESRPERHFRQEDCSPGTSYAARQSRTTGEPTCCYQTSNTTKATRKSGKRPGNEIQRTEDRTSGSSITTGKVHPKNPRLIVKKNSSRNKHCSKDEPNLEHYILLPTLVIKTPSNMKRQKKFSELYHRILNVHMNQVLGVLPSEKLRQWMRSGEKGKLERTILAGQGHRLLAEADDMPLSRHITNMILKCDALHAAIEKGSLLQLQVELELLDYDYNRHKHVMCLDKAGVGLLHKAVYYNYMDIAQWLVDKYPQLVHQRDSEGRTPLHYTAACHEEAAAAALLERAGAARCARDAAGRTLAHYRAARTLLVLPTAVDMPARPNVNPPGLVIKRHNIRIWCHECDMGRLQRVVWEGQGARLLSEVSSQPIVKKFLEAVPYIMNTIREIHNAVIQNDLEGIMKLTSDPVPSQALSSRDANNMTAMHKAAGLGHCGILKYIIERYPQGISDVDNDGRTPLHYAAVVKDDQHTYNTLISAGADESAVDNKNKTPTYYINRTQDIDKSLFKILPEAPRTPSSNYPSSWDWKILDTEFIGDFSKKTRKKTLKASNENISSKNNTSTISDAIESNNFALKNSSTHELISDLPDLNDSEKENSQYVSNEDNTQNIKETTEIEEIKESNEDGDKSLNIEDTKDDLKEVLSDDGKLENISHEPSLEGVENIEKKEKLEIDELNEDDVTNNTCNDDKEEEKEENLSELDLRTDTQDKSEIANEIVGEKLITHEDAHESPQSILETNHSNEDKLESNIYNSNNNDHDNNDNQKSIDGADTTSKGTDTHDTYNTEKKVNGSHNEKQEEDPCKTTSSEGNTSNDNNEDDEDVQVQGSSYPEHCDIHTKSNTIRQNNGIARRGNVTNGRNIQENLIEGIVTSEAEQETQDASIAHRLNSIYSNDLIVDNEIDPEVTDLINTANMEMLATLVLNGEGSRLIGRHSRNVELQAFLDNVPIYMQKINKVHIAARDGNIRDLQAALDRRKFAIARDPISANGATPLHVATIYGKTNIIKYLGGRFPETLSAVDFEGRTALHFAAVLPDNGHFYNLLQQLGANSKDLDDIGRSAEDYYHNSTLLPFRQLLFDFGISEEKAQAMFSDQGMNHVANGHMDIPIFHTDEGRYLAKSLGDPLIKGLTEVANVKPKDPVAFLATFLQNFPNHEKPRLGTQETNTIVTRGTPEVENEELPLEFERNMEETSVEPTKEDRARTAARTTTRPHRPIEVIAVENTTENMHDAPETASSSANRDEHGQSMLHFAAARSHTNNALFQLLQESDVSVGYRDELYRTARDVSIQANVLENTNEIDRWLLHLAARGKTDKIMELLLQGYDHILDVVDDQGVPIAEVVAQRGDNEMANLLASIPAFEESREALHGAVRRGDLTAVQDMVIAEGGRTLARAQNTLGRTALHIAVLCQHEDIVAYLAENCPEILRLGDNLERTPLHYAMGVNKMEPLSRLLIQAGAKRVLKDLKGRQPSYYFMNKSDILRLKEEEEAY